jgi:hypothetical protein
MDGEGDFGLAQEGTLDGYRWLAWAGGRSNLGSEAVALPPSVDDRVAVRPAITVFEISVST